MLLKLAVWMIPLLTMILVLSAPAQAIEKDGSPQCSGFSISESGKALTELLIADVAFGDKDAMRSKIELYRAFIPGILSVCIFDNKEEVVTHTSPFASSDKEPCSDRIGASSATYPITSKDKTQFGKVKLIYSRQLNAE